MEEVTKEDMAKTLYGHWQSSDRELQTTWEELEEGNQLRVVFMRQAQALEDAGFGRV